MDDRTPLHTAAAHDAITAELVACTLGQRQRLELRVDVAGRIQQQLHAMVQRLRGRGPLRVL